MNTLIELGPNLRASLEAIAPGESVPEQLCILLAQRNALLEALQELRQYADLKLQGHRQDYPEDHCMIQTALRMIALADNAIALAQGGDK